ncbi:MAG: LamG-like jellyroll fold domain-containing protein, partial [Candidatus Thorarchaeota archaeon]
MKKSQRKNAFLIMLILIFNWSSITKKTSWIIEINSSGHQLLISEEAQNSKTIAYPSSFTNKENSLRLNLRSSPSSSAPWADVRFSYRKSIRLFSSKVVENLTSFPVLIDIHDSDLKEVDQANGNDILFTDCLGNKLAHEIEKFDRDFNSSHAHLVAWVKTNLSCVEDTPIMLYYGNPSVSNQEESEWVWDNNYIGVWHLSEKSGIHYDSTGNHVDGSPQSFDNDEAVEGKINGADELDGINDYIDIYKNPDEIGLEGKGSITISMWIYTNGFNGGGILEFGDPEVSMAYYSLGTLSQPNVWRANWGGTKYDEFTYKSLNRWVNFVITYQNDAISNQNANDSDDSIQNLEIYGNSQLLMNKKLILNIQNGSTLKFGKWEKNTFNGSIDEMRVSRVARSAAWIQTEFNNQNDPTSFYSTGPQEVDTNPPQINEFGVNDNGKGNIIFYANVTDELTQVKNVSIKINGSEYYMKQNDSDLWIYQYPWANFGDFIEYRVANASDAHGNWITTKAIKFIKLSKDTTTPDILQWEYYYDTNTFKANVRDIWGKIDKVILNVTSHNLMATMVHCTINTDNIATYINDTLKIPNGPIEFQIIVNDTSGNVYVSPPHSGFVSLNHAPFVENITFSPFNVFSNSTLELSYDYYDEDNHSELGTEIRWFKNDGTGFILQTKYNDETKIPSSALVRNDQWYVTIKPKDGTIYGELVNSSDTSGLISILNTPPEVTIYEDKHPEFILEDQDIILEDSYFDFLDWDGDQDQSIIYWFKNGTLQPEYTNQTYIPADTTQPGETWYYIIQSYDGLDYGAYETSSIIVI